MLKMICEDWKREGTTRDQCIEHLANNHAPLVQRCSNALGIVKYIQNLRIPCEELDSYTSKLGWAEAPDSSVEVWFESAERMASSTPEAAEASRLLEEDEYRFVNSSLISAFLTQEEVLVDNLGSEARRAPKSSIVKVACQLSKRPGDTLASFSNRWRQHGALVKKHAAELGIIRYVQNHTVPSEAVEAFAQARGWRQPPDGLSEMWWDSRESLTAALTEPKVSEVRDLLVADEAEYTHPKRNAAFLSREHFVFSYNAD